MAVFFVFQGDTYQEEKEGGYVWSPQLNSVGHKNAGFSLMTQIKKYDYILHSWKGQLKAISIADGDCFEADIPSEKHKSKKYWSDKGYRVNTHYYELEVPLKLRNHREWLRENVKSHSPFSTQGTGKQQYMSKIDDEQIYYLLTQAAKIQKDESILRIINEILSDLKDDNSDNYDSIEIVEINKEISSLKGIDINYKFEKKPQEVISISNKGEKPKRNPKIAAYALARANFKCEYDKTHKLFERKSGEDYTEPHHLIPISKYRDFEYEKCSLDTMENIVSLCSHCHNLLHYGKMVDKEPILKQLYEERIEYLKRVGLNIEFEELKKYYE